MRDEKGTWNPGGRSVAWRVAMIVGGLLFGGAGVAVLLWPWLLTWFLAAVCITLGAFLVVSALLARGRA